MQNEIVFVMLTCIQSSQAFPSGEDTAAGAWNAHLHLIAKVKKEWCYTYAAILCALLERTRKMECFSVTLYSGFEIQRSVDICESDLIVREDCCAFEETIQVCRGHTHVGTFTPNYGTRLRWVVRTLPQPCYLQRERIPPPTKREAWLFPEPVEKRCLLLHGIQTLDHPAHGSVTKLTKLYSYM